MLLSSIHASPAVASVVNVNVFVYCGTMNVRDCVTVRPMSRLPDESKPGAHAVTLSNDSLRDTVHCAPQNSTMV